MFAFSHDNVTDPVVDAFQVVIFLRNQPGQAFAAFVTEDFLDDERCAHIVSLIHILIDDKTVQLGTQIDSL